MALFEWKNFSFTYAGANKKTLKKIDLDIKESEFLLLSGASGSGKSTLLHQMKKNLIPYGTSEGKIYYKGIEINNLNSREDASEIGFVMQDPEIQIVTDQVWHELAFGLENLGLERAVIHRRIAEMVSFFGIESWFYENTHQLSGGQKQLLNLASVMAMHPEVLILDEPTAQLDPIAAENFIGTLAKINHEIGTTVFISEHRMEELMSIADRVLIMEEGIIKKQGTAREVADYFAAHPKETMFEGMPAPLKIYMSFQKEKNNKMPPISVKEGKEWLTDFLKDKNTDAVSLERKDEKKETKAVLRVENFWFHYKEQMDVLKGTSFTLHEGEWLTILGGNGAGKSTLLKCICDIEKPYRGKIAVKQKLRMLTQNPQALFTEITVKEELEEAFAGTKQRAEDIEKRVKVMLEKMHLLEYEKIHPYDLSGGEQQRLALGKILLLEPEILVLDEPTKGLDPLLKKELAKILKEEVLKVGGSILMVSHDINFCAMYADRCGLLFDGQLLEALPPQKFFAENHFYTTQANRMAKKYWKEAVTSEEVVWLCEEAMTKTK